jgi:hypothetical protein
MTPENPGGREFAQFMTNKIFRYIHGNPGFAIIDRDGSTHHFRNDSGTPGIGFYHFFIPGLAHIQHFLVEALFNKGPFLD